MEKFRNTKFLQKINIDPVKSSACSIDPDDFADFLKDIFADSNVDNFETNGANLSRIPSFTDAELEDALKQLSNLRK